ncbi:MAG: PEP-CTERM sorting domain-containing protein [Verrucomicrobiota bacterium]|nr:PEP-CTERM sorting domain-containing protein [Verrucomicrobiota bacterium]
MKTAAMRIILLVALGAALSGISAWAQPLIWSDDFDVDHSANWSTWTLGTGSDANFFFDYSTVGIPSAPHSSGTTMGLRLRANQYGSTATFPGGVSVSPIGLNLTGDYKLRFDAWLNFNGPAPGGGSGSSQITGAGIGTAGTSAQIAGGVIDSINFGTSGEGGTSADYRAYAPAAQASYQDNSGVYAAGTTAGVRNNSHAYYAGFGGASAPAAQLALYPQQTGTVAAGALGWEWRDMEITKIGNTVTWSVDNLLLATVDLTTAGTLGGGNILFNQYDINSTVSTDPNSPDLLFGLIDNVRVTMIPEPASGALALLGGLGLFAAWRRRK